MPWGPKNIAVIVDVEPWKQRKPVNVRKNKAKLMSQNVLAQSWTPKRGHMDLTVDVMARVDTKGGHKEG